MRKIFSIVLIIVSMIIVSSCGASNKVSNNPYTGEGYGESFDKNIAHDKAYTNAIADVCRKYNIVVNEVAKQAYHSTNTGKGKAQENLAYNSNTYVESEVNATDVVEKVKYTYKGKVWGCTVVVSVSPDNLQ